MTFEQRNNITDQLRYIQAQLCVFWRDKGFGFIESDRSFTVNGRIECTLNMNVRSCSIQTGVSEDEKEEQKKKRESNLKKMGFQFIENNVNGFYPLANDNNFKLLGKMLFEKYPSIRIESYDIDVHHLLLNYIKEVTVQIPFECFDFYESTCNT